MINRNDKFYANDGTENNLFFPYLSIEEGLSFALILHIWPIDSQCSYPATSPCFTASKWHKPLFPLQRIKNTISIKEQDEKSTQLCYLRSRFVPHAADEMWLKENTKITKG